MPFYIFIFLLGLAMGSFLNVVIYRLPRGLPIGQGRSFCPNCGRKLTWRENLPLFSFLFLKGKCSRCRAKISFQYPIVELTTGILFLLALRAFNHKFIAIGFPNFPNSRTFISFLVLLALQFVLISCLIAIFFIDLKHYIIPDSLVIIGTITALVYLFLSQFIVNNLQLIDSNSRLDLLFNQIFLNSRMALSLSPFINHLIFAIIGGSFFSLIVLLTKGKGMGIGDLKLAALMGLILGSKLIIALYLAFITGAIFGIFLILLKKKSLKTKIPFGPFLAGATLLLMII